MQLPGALKLFLSVGLRYQTTCLGTCFMFNHSSSLRAVMSHLSLFAFICVQQQAKSQVTSIFMIFWTPCGLMCPPPMPSAGQWQQGGVGLVGAAGCHCSAAACGGHPCCPGGALRGLTATWRIQLEAVRPGEAATCQGTQACGRPAVWGVRFLQWQRTAACCCRSCAW